LPLKHLRAACLLVGLAVATPALADPAYVSLGAGGTDVLNQGARAAADFRMEYLSGLSLLPFFETYFKVKPWAGVEVTSRSALWTGGGIYLDIPITEHWLLTPNFGVGYYDAGRGKNLGSFVEFRSTFEGGYQFDNGTRLMAAFGHTSNAGLTRHNPGTEMATIYYEIPLTTIASMVTH
jgi:hypothetical protein